MLRTLEVPQSSEAREQRAGTSGDNWSSYRPDIDGLRAVAALAVVAAHAGWLHGGGFGVDIFFVISGYLISGIIFRALQDGHFSILDFYARRAKRIFPALIVLLTSVSVLGWIVLPSSDRVRLGQDVIAGAAFVQNLWLYVTIEQRDNAAGSLLSHLWTLGVEEQFYLLWPLLLTTTWLLLRKWRLRSMVVTTALSFGSYGWALSTDPPGWLLPYNRLWELALGAILAYFQYARSVGVPRAWIALLLQPPANRLLATLGAIGATIALIGIEPFDEWPSGYVWMPVVGAFLVISGGRDHWINRRVLGTPAMVFLGLISYPLYLWHWSLFMLVAILHGQTGTSGFRQVSLVWKITAIAASFALSYLTYRYVELPLRSSRNTRGVALLLCVAMVVCCVLAYSILGEQ